MRQIKTILVPVDFTDYSNSVVDYAVMLAKPFKAKMILIHVIEPFAYSTTDTLMITDHYKALKEISRRLMEALHLKVSRKGVKVRSLVVRGVPYAAIVEQAGKSRSSLVVMGTRGRKGFERFLLGSVAERVVRLAPCPVITVRVGG